MAFENLKSTGITYLLTKLKDYFLQIKDAVKTVNGEEPDTNGDITISTVPYAQNLESESTNRNYGTFIQRMSGGDGSVSDGDAWLINIKGNSEHEGFVAESLSMTVNTMPDSPITATLDRDTFVEYVTQDSTITLTYSTEWSADPTDYGVTVTGNPVAGDNIVINYVNEVRGQITVANPQSFVATGWNLYNNLTGYARVILYPFGYRVDGTYTKLQYSATLTGTKTDVTVTDHYFDIPADGFIWVTGGNATNTAIYPTWEDWTEDPDKDFETYQESEVDLSSIMTTYFPYGLMKAGSVVDEIDLNLGQVIRRVDRLAYSDSNRADAEATGREYEFDEDYIYLAKAPSAITPVSVEIDGNFSSCDHGIEFFTQTDVSIYAEALYGANLKNKLERDVLTISSQMLADSQKAQARENIGAASASTVADIESYLNGMLVTASYSVSGTSIAAGDVASYSVTITKTGYKALGIITVTVSNSGTCSLVYYANNATTATVKLRNNGNAAHTPNKIGVYILYVKEG